MFETTGIGTDLCSIPRMRPLLENDAFLERCFWPEEIGYVRNKGAVAADSLAGLWAAKEAVLKALGTGMQISMRDIMITHTENGAPVCRLYGKAKNLVNDGRVLVSISHECELASAYALWQMPI